TPGCIAIDHDGIPVFSRLLRFRFGVAAANSCVYYQNSLDIHRRRTADWRWLESNPPRFPGVALLWQLPQPRWPRLSLLLIPEKSFDVIVVFSFNSAQLTISAAAAICRSTRTSRKLSRPHPRRR